jgi:signal transduction histidine kinase/ActR/RegA family two-component response regulator
VREDADEPERAAVADRTPHFDSDASTIRQVLSHDHDPWQVPGSGCPGAALMVRIAPRGRMIAAHVSPEAALAFGAAVVSGSSDPAPILARIHPVDLPAVRQAFIAAASTLSPLRCQFRYCHPERGQVLLSVHVLPVREPDGSTIWSGVAIDSRAEQMRDREVSTLRSQLDTAMEAADLGAYIIDLKRAAMWGSDIFRRIFGLGSEISDVHSVSIPLACLHEDDRARVQAEFSLAFEAQTSVAVEFRILRSSDRAMRFLATRARIERDAEGRAQRVVGVAMDVTRQRLTAEAEARSHKLEALGTLAAGIAHDFNNVLHVIAGRAALAMTELPDFSPARQHVNELVQASMRGGDIVARILSFSRPREKSPDALDLRGEIQGILEFLRPTLPSNVSVQLGPDSHVPAVFADPTELHQIVVNLVANAVHAIGRKTGTITLSLEAVQLEQPAALAVAELPAGRYVRLTVADDGIGMDAPTLSRVFDPYFTTKPIGEGTGLGLAVVSSLVRSSGGGVHVHSEAGKGTAFQVYLCQADRRARMGDRASRSSLPRGSGQRVLFVDDEPTLAVLGRDILQFLGYAPDAYSDPEQAAAAFLAAPAAYAAVLTDLTMAKLDGFALAALVRSRAPSVPVLVMSGLAQFEVHAQAEALGVAHVLAKPLSLYDLARILRSVVPET